LWQAWPGVLILGAGVLPGTVFNIVLNPRTTSLHPLLAMRKATNHLKKADPTLAAIIETIGPCRMEYGEPEFHTLAEAIVYQQLHGKAAFTIFKRFTDLAGDPLTPEGILKLSEAQMRGAGLSGQKLSYLRDLAAKTKAGLLNFAELPALSDQEVIERLTQVKGIGEWTAHMFLMFALRRPNVLPTGDLGVQMAIRKHYKKRKLPKPAQMEKIAKCWEPYRSVACWYMWKSMDTKTI
jgi:DNA-3-methyladenine glycosylase II